MGHPLQLSDNLPDGPAVVHPSSPYPQFFHTDPACSTFFSSAMNINGYIHSKPLNSFTTPSSIVVVAAAAAAATTASTTSTTSTNKPTWKPASPASSSSAPLTMNPSRKRSRDDYIASSSTSYSIEDDQRDSGFGSTAASSPAIEETDPTYGDAMILVNHEHTTNNTNDCSSSSLDLRSRKLQRLDTSASAWDDTTMATIQAKLQSSSSNTNTSSSTQDHHHQPKRQPSSSSFTPLTPQDPQVDPITILLGISWQRVSRTDDADIAAALRGWERYIQNHYAGWIAQAEILLRHRGVGAFLVAGRVPTSTSTSSSSMLNADTNGSGGTRFYLFSEDLAEARLVGNDWDSCLRNLREVPIRYEDGPTVLRASSSLTSSTSTVTGSGSVAERAMEDKGVLIECVRYANGSGGDGDGDAMAMGMGVGMGMDIDYW
ncbi:hypothetical protein EMCG_06544 [[Emmonsia] crescens]|uniref:Uncharacterized protein n=1 Tax=[Emmonsia] crescens TaxID=73230 RepID=A0A0G2IB68_9EURO|nr:hypothetical protein EMCG_06544 [Emmonsia crescens UAMH 3008]